MLQEMGYDSDPVKAWKQAQEKVHRSGCQMQWALNKLSHQNKMNVYYRMRRRRRTVRRRRKRTLVAQTTTTSLACPCGF